MTSSVAFEFYTESTAGHETTWHVTADITFEHGRYFADLTGAYPEGETAAEYDVSDLEWALAEEANGRELESVKQAAIDAYCEQAEREAGRRECDLERVGT
jgi:hypothetical protein